MTNEQREAIELLEGIRDNTWTTKYIMSSDSKKSRNTFKYDRRKR